MSSCFQRREHQKIEPLRFYKDGRAFTRIDERVAMVRFGQKRTLFTASLYVRFDPDCVAERR
jgi:hypothetical protein